MKTASGGRSTARMIFSSLFSLAMVVDISILRGMSGFELFATPSELRASNENETRAIACFEREPA